MAMFMASRQLSGGSMTQLMLESLRFTACWRSFSTSFREERDTFGPIMVPSDKFVLPFLFSFNCCWFQFFIVAVTVSINHGSL